MTDAPPPGETTSNEVLRADGLSMHYASRKARGWRKRSMTIAVDNVSLGLRAGETLAVVGESGSGKTTLARILVGLQAPTNGAVYVHGHRVDALRSRDLRTHRRTVQMVFQDPYSSLHPRRRVHRIVSEPWRVHDDIEPPANWPERTSELLDMVGLHPQMASRFSSQLSGGERQRVALARALAIRPEIVVLDEPVSALDVSIQAQVVKLLMTLQERLALSYIFISHDLPLVKLVADRVIVMSSGRVVEEGSAAAVYRAPQSETTRLLLNDI